MIGMLGNAMNFLAYLFMGIPAGKLLTKIGYKKTALTGIATGFVGVLIQFLSGKFGADISGFAVYLFGAFISGLLFVFEYCCKPNVEPHRWWW